MADDGKCSLDTFVDIKRNFIKKIYYIFIMFGSTRNIRIYYLSHNCGWRTDGALPLFFDKITRCPVQRGKTNRFLWQTLFPFGPRLFTPPPPRPRPPGHKTRRFQRSIRLYAVFRYQCEPALVYDSVQVLAVGLGALQQNNVLGQPNVSCKDGTPWRSGSSLINYMNSVGTRVIRLKN